MALFLDYGDGRTGSAAGVSGTVNTYATATATGGTNTVSSTLSVAIGDEVLLIQMSGTNAGSAKVYKVATVNAGVSFTTTESIEVTHGPGCQAILVPQYTLGTTGAITAPSWNGSTGGVAIVIAQTDINIGGASGVPGGNGAVITNIGSNNTGGATVGGFRGGNAFYHTDSPHTSWQGEGTSGVGTQTTANNVNGGGGANWTNQGFPASGGGGGHANSGTNGTGGGNPSAGTGGTAGAAIGNADLTTIFMGGGGGGGAADVNLVNSVGAGGSGGGIFIVIAPTITISGSISVNGGNGGTGHVEADGGGGAGGSVLLYGNTIVLGSNLVTALGGAGGDGPSAGSVGRIAVYSPDGSLVSGTTNPTYTLVASSSSNNSQGYII